MIVILQTEIQVPDGLRSWDAKQDAKWQFEADIATLINDAEKLHNFIDRMSATIYEPPEPETDYETEARNDAKELITDYFMDEIVQQLIDDGEASNDLNNNYTDGDSIFHENIVDRSYSTEEATKLLSDLYRHEETDSGIWHGLEWDRALAAKAAYTYGNVVYSEWSYLIKQINGIMIDDVELDVALDILVDERSPVGMDDMLDSDIVEYAKEHHEEEFNTKLEAALRASVLETLS